MKLRNRNLVDLAALQNFEQIEGLLSALLGGDYKIRFGTVTVTYPGGSVLSSAATVTHGLGRVPTVVLAMGMNGSGSGVVAATTETYTATTFSTRVQDVSGVSRAAGFAVLVAWIAIG